MNRSVRLLAGSLVLAVPLAAAAGCGAAKKKTVKQEFDAAQSHLGDAKAASFTLHFDDAQGNLLKAVSGDDGVPAAVAQALLKGSVTYVADAPGNATLGSVRGSVSDPTDFSGVFKNANAAFVVKDDQDTVAELRIVAGTLYAHVNLGEISRLAKAGGADDFDSQLDDAVKGMDPRFKQALADVRAGKWLKLPLTKYLDKLKDLTKSFPGATPGATPSIDANNLGKRVYGAVKPYVKVTDANNSSSDRVLDVNVQVKPALKAVLAVLSVEPGLPFASMFKDAGKEIDKHVKDGIAKGQIRLHNSHLTQVSVDIESIRQLATDPGSTSFAGVKVLVDVDDSADELQAPSNVSGVDVAALVEGLFGSLFGSMTGSVEGAAGFSG